MVKNIISLTNRTWFSIVCTLIDNKCMSSQRSKCCGLERHSQECPQQILTTVVARIIVDKSTDNAKPHSICFYHNINTKESGFFSEHEVERKLKMALRDTLTLQPCLYLIDNSKLANQIAKFVAIVVKLLFKQCDYDS